MCCAVDDDDATADERVDDDAHDDAHDGGHDRTPGDADGRRPRSDEPHDQRPSRPRSPDDTPPTPDALRASERADEALEAQRDRHQPDDAEVDDDGIAQLVDNTGWDGDAPTG
jgi:hypothetical protein